MKASPVNEMAVQGLPLEQLELAVVLYIAGKVGPDSSMTVDDIRACIETLQRVGARYVEQSRRS